MDSIFKCPELNNLNKEQKIYVLIKNNMERSSFMQ